MLNEPQVRMKMLQKVVRIFIALSILAAPATGCNSEKGDEQWVNWQYAGDRLMKEIQIGEVHIHGDDLYFHSARPGGKGDYDIGVTTRDGDLWSDPINIDAVNTDVMDGFPFISTDGNEL